MGEAKIRSIRDLHPITFDYHVPALYIAPGDRAQLLQPDEDEIRLIPRAVRHVLTTVVHAAFPQGAGRRDREFWAGWQETMRDEGPPVHILSYGHVRWLRDILGQEKLLLPVGLAQWAQAVLDYLTFLSSPEPVSSVEEEP